MKRIVILVCFTLTLNSKAFVNFFSSKDNLSNCPGLTKTQLDIVSSFDDDTLEKMAKHKDTEKINKLNLEIYQVYCKDKKFITMAKKKFNEINKLSWKYGAERMAEEIERVSQFKAPLEEIKQLDEFAKKLEINPLTILTKEKKILFLKNGKANASKTKKKCSNIDNRKKPLKDNIRDQDGIGWCYAFTAADLISHRLKRTISAFDIANTFNQGFLGSIEKNVFRMRESKIEGGFIASAISSAVKKGLCLEKNIRSSNHRFAKMGHLINELKELEKFKDNFDKSTY